MTNPEFSALFKDLELNIIKLMETIGAIPEQISQYMQSQTNAPLPGPGQSPSMNPLGGMLPGSSSMDMLQLQQFLQMQQMQQLQQQGNK
jgi:hypothetical protein